jgi:hypothetical protein
LFRKLVKGISGTLRDLCCKVGTHGVTGNEVTLTQDVVVNRADDFFTGSTVRVLQIFGQGPVLLDEEWVYQS